LARKLDVVVGDGGGVGLDGHLVEDFAIAESEQSGYGVGVDVVSSFLVHQVEAMILQFENQANDLPVTCREGGRQKERYCLVIHDHGELVAILQLHCPVLDRFNEPEGFGRCDASGALSRGQKSRPISDRQPGFFFKLFL